MIKYNIHTNIPQNEFILKSFNNNKETFKNYNYITKTEYIKNHSILNNLIIYYITTTYLELTEFINFISKYKPKYYTYVYSYNKNKHVITTKILEEKNISIHKFINIFYNSSYSSLNRLFTDDYHYMYINDETYYNFIIEKYILNNCGAGRLIQGPNHTCWLISAINGFLLTKKLRNNIIQLLKFEKKELINSSNLTLKDLFYNILINNKYKSYNNKNDNISIYIKNSIHLNFCSNIKNLNMDQLINYKKFKLCDVASALYLIINQIFLKKNIYFVNNIMADLKLRNIEIYNNFNSNTLFYCKISQTANEKIIYVNNIKFKLCFLIIHSEVYKNNKEQEFSHVMCCYKCNKNYFIYDSAYGANMNIDWRNYSEINYIYISDIVYKFIKFYCIYIRV